MSQPLNSEILRNVTEEPNGQRHKIPSYVKCWKCGRPPEGANWLKNVYPDPRKFVHILCEAKP